MLEILQMIAALATVATGVYSLVAPLKVRGFTGLELPGCGNYPWNYPDSLICQ